jgi:hypothetical protein
MAVLAECVLSRIAVALVRCFCCTFPSVYIICIETLGHGSLIGLALRGVRIQFGLACTAWYWAVL